MDTQPTTITAVTVFPDRARVTRSATVELAAGVQRVRFGDLPIQLHPDSLRAAARGTAGATLLGVHVTRRFYNEAPAERLQALERESEAAQDAQSAREGESAAVAREQAHLDDLAAQARTYARALSGRRPDGAGQADAVARQGQIYDFIAGRKAALRARALELGQAQRAGTRELERLQRELARLRTSQPRERYEADVELELTTPGSLTVELSYLVNGARWAPLYDLRLDENQLRARYLASITQTTGEEWLGVALTLSTAQPALSLVVPELAPWYLDPYVPPPPRQRSGFFPGATGGAQAAPAPLAAGELREEADEVDRLVAQEASVALATVAAAGAAVTYALPGRSDVPGNGEPHKVTVAEFVLAPRFDYVCAPKLAQAVYRRAQVVNTSPYLLLPGPAQLFEGQEYLGATALELTAPGQAVELVLGVDERMRVERELKGRDVDRRLLGDQRRVHYRYAITVENLTGAEQRVCVRDQLPVARHESVKVKLDGASPKLEPGDLGLLEWTLVLADRAQQTITFEFTVESPTSFTLSNLP